MATAVDPSTSSTSSDEAAPPSTSSASTNEAEAPSTSSTSTNQAGTSSIIKRSKCISRLGDPGLFDVLSIIFKYTSARDLRRCSMVCRIWADAAQQKLAIRPARFEWEALFSRLMPVCINHVFRSDPEPLDAYVHAFYRHDLRQPSPDGINRHPDTTDLDRASSDSDRFADDYFGSMRNVPQLTLCFTSAKPDLEKRVHDSLMQKRPKNSHVVTICSTTGVTCTAKRPNGEITMEFDRKGEAISLVSLPVHPGFRCYVHAFGDLPDDARTAKDIVNQIPPQDRKRVKGMLAFAESAPTAVAAVYETLRDEYKRTRDFKGKFTRGTGTGPKIAFAGGLGRKLYANDVNETDSENVVIFLCGDDRLGIESFVLKRMWNDKSVVETKITEFADAIKAKFSPNLTQGIGLQCACLGRGEPFYNNWNVESDAFRTNFPDFPLFGFFGDGEVGCDSEPLQQTGKPDENVEHSYCTAFMVIACTDN